MKLFFLINFNILESEVSNFLINLKYIFCPTHTNTDSKSALQHLAQCASGQRGVSIAYTVLGKINNSMGTDMDLRLQWNPSHIDVSRNEEADRLKMACSEGSEVFIQPYFSEVLINYRHKLYDMWNEYFDQRSKKKGIWYRILQNHPPRMPWSEKVSFYRVMIQVLKRLRSGHLPLNKFAYLMKKSSTPNCPLCGVVQDVQHLLIECVRHESERRCFKDNSSLVMAIQSFEKFKLKNKIIPSSSKSSNLSSTKLMKFDCGAIGNISSNNSEYDTKENKNISPYLTGDRIHLLSRITEKKFVHKRTADYMSSLPLAVNIYKANSDQFRLSKKRSKKVKKSVLTLPNEHLPLPQACTVSDMNDSECFNNDNDDENIQKSKRKRPVKSRKPLKCREIRMHDRDLKYCSQLNIDLDKSSTEIINTGDGKKVAMKYRSKNKKNVCGSDKSYSNAHDVWSVLRNVDDFQFRTTPSLSQESVSVKKRKTLKRRQNKQGDARFIETCRTEEFAYISSFIDHALHNANSQSSVDRITVIDKKDDFQKMCRNIDKECEMRKPRVLRTEKYSCQNNKAILKKKRRKQSEKIVLEHKSCDSRINNENSDSEMTSKENLNIETTENKKTKPSNTSTFSNKIVYENCNDNIFQFGIGGSCEKESNTSDHSGLVSGMGSLTEVRSISHKLTSKDPEQVTGITKVVLSKGQKILLSKQIEAAKRKSRLTSPLPNNLTMPKLTQTEIKRRLACLRFPLIILGKDQLSSTVEIQSCSSPQFDGLDEHIWPFMKNWFCKGNYDFSENDIKRENIEIKCSNFKHDNITYINDVQNRNSGNVDYINVKTMLKDTHNENIQAVKPEKVIVKQLVVQKEKAMHKVKDKMLQLIRKKSLSKCSIKTNVNTNRHVTETRLRTGLPLDIVNVSTNTTNEVIDELGKREGKNVRRNSLNKSYQWTKKKWASEFIDNVIRKIKNGVYFYQDDKNYLQKSYFKTDVSVQTEVIVNQNCVQDLQVMTKDSDAVTSIPGFDNRLTDLEIETVQNYNQISVKHCITNLVIQFDVALTRDNNCVQIKKSFSYIPVKENGNPKIFKCKSAIANAILPAEICSILPNLMIKVINANSKLVYPALTINRVESHLPAITEITRCESDDTIKQLCSFNIDLSPRIEALFQGKFREIISGNKIRFYKQQTIDLPEAQKILSKININLSCTGVGKQSTLIYNLFSLTKPVLSNKDLKYVELKPTGMALEPYLESKRKVYPAFEKFNFKTFVETLLSHTHLHININAPFINNLKFKNNVFVSIEADDVENIEKATYTITNLTINAIYNGFKERCNTENNAINYSNDTNNFETNKKYIDKRKTRAEFCLTSYRNKKRGYVKLYKKCKSMSNLPNERSSTSLNKITNLDEFIIALGSSKTLASVFDGNIEKKILSSIKEMKNWMTEITPRQALLVLLLANKKDTTSLVRYHPIILQGIAVNRITRATELDMEIEVIETENLNIRSKYDGITYLNASLENQDTLFEELCWIAKTTASDYQKTFDESSERHLKSLLKKRKKLNPSYLRVMARYVGLGLLKSSK